MEQGCLNVCWCPVGQLLKGRNNGWNGLMSRSPGHKLGLAYPAYSRCCLDVAARLHDRFKINTGTYHTIQCCTYLSLLRTQSLWLTLGMSVQLIVYILLVTPTLSSLLVYMNQSSVLFCISALISVEYCFLKYYTRPAQTNFLTLTSVPCLPVQHKYALNEA